MTAGGQFWIKSLGKFRQLPRQLINQLGIRRVAIDISGWNHKFDQIYAVQYARTSNPQYPHPTIISSVSAKYEALKALHITPVFVFDGKPPPLKKRTNVERSKESNAARIEYDAQVKAIRERAEAVTEDEREKILKLRRESARPIPHEYASLSQWMKCNGIDYVQAPFEADAQIKQLILEGTVDAAITEDGDLVVFGVPSILSLTKIDTLDPKKSDCEFFNIDDLKSGKYDSPIAEGYRSDYLAEISCLLGNDYIDNIFGIGPAALYGSHRSRKDQVSFIDSYIDEVVKKKTKSVVQWLEEYASTNRKTSGAEDTNNDGENGSDNWTPEYFIKVRNAILHYPIFAKDEDTGLITLQPLRPLPDGVSLEDWGSYIGFDKHPAEYFSSDKYKYSEYYDMSVVGSRDQSRAELLGPRYTQDDNAQVSTDSILPLFARLDFQKDPIEIQPIDVLRAYLHARGTLTPSNISADKIREMAHTAHEVKKRVVDPELVPEGDSWVGFEPLEEEAMGDDYDNWVSKVSCCLLAYVTEVPSNCNLLSQNNNFVNKIRQLRKVTQEMINEHFGTERAQYERDTAFVLLGGGNLGCCKTMKVRNVKSKLAPEKHLIVFTFKCLSKERAILHTVYMVFENADNGDYIPSPASYCTCENGAFFCSHMLCFLYFMRVVQSQWGDKTQKEIIELMPEDRRITANVPCLLEMVLCNDHIKRQTAQSKRQVKARSS